jgi:phage terminase small subunit
MKKGFDYQGAKEAGYSDEEIMSHLSESTPDFDIQAAIESGYSPEEINEHLSTYKPQRSKSAKAGRIGLQAGKGLLQSATIMPDIAAMGANAFMKAPHVAEQKYRENVFEDIERLYEQKQTGVWDEQDENLLGSLLDQVHNPEKMKPFIEEGLEKGSEINAFLAPSHAIEKGFEAVTGIDTKAEGIAEKAANWIGFLKNPKDILNLSKGTIGVKNIIQAINPGATNTLRGLSAGTALEMAEEGNFGPMGTLAALLVGDVVGMGPKGLWYTATNPKKVVAETINLFTRGNSKKAWSNEILSQAKEAGLQLDAGTITNSDFIRMLQTRASQSGLTGAPLENFMKDQSAFFVKEYEKIADSIENLEFESAHQAGEAIRDSLKRTENIFESAPKNLKEEQGAARSLQGRVATEARPENIENNFLNRIAPDEFRNSSQAGETLRVNAEEIRQPIKEQFNERWEQFDHEVTEIEAPQAELAEDLRQFVGSREGSLLLGESTAEARVLRAADNLLQRIETEGGLISISLSDLIKTKRTLADVADFEFGGSNFQSAYKKLVGDVNRAVERTLEQENPALMEAYQELNQDYTQYKNIFENKSVLSLFERGNENYNNIYNSIIRDPDKMRAVENILHNTPQGQRAINQMKRDYAQRVISKPNVTQREIRDLSSVLGENFERDLQNYSRARQYLQDHPLPVARPQGRLGVNTSVPQTPGTRIPSGKTLKVKETAESVQGKYYDYLKGKSNEQIIKKMDTLSGIKELKRVLSLTPEGKELFEKLSRFKIEQMIGKEMKDNLTNQLKNGKFKNLFTHGSDQAVARELLGNENFEKIRNLQKYSDLLSKSQQKFFNASKSGTTVADIALIGSFATGLLSGNPYLVSKAVLGYSATRWGSKLLSDPEFLKILEEVVMSNTQEKFMKLLEKMTPAIDKAITEMEQESE